METTPSAFNEHLEVVRVAREHTDQAIAPLESSRDYADRAIQITWQLLFDHLCRERKKKKSSMPNLQDYAAIIHRLVQSMGKLGSFDKLAKAVQREQVLTLADGAGLPPELRADLERELNLI
jgi:hypothetical protein